jgi:hypothetical protein
MRWLPIFFMLCGFSINQSLFLGSMVEAVWETGALFPASSTTCPAAFGGWRAIGAGMISRSGQAHAVRTSVHFADH